MNASHLKDLLAKLDSKQYSVRKKAERALEELGDLAAETIREQLSRTPSLEMTRRLEAVAKKLDRRLTTADVLRSVRAIEVLERIGSPEARRVLRQLAQGAPGHRATEEARRTLLRIGDRWSTTGGYAGMVVVAVTPEEGTVKSSLLGGGGLRDNGTLPKHQLQLFFQ